MKFEKGDVVYCEDTDDLLIIISETDFNDGSYWCEFGWSFGIMQYIISDYRLTLISKSDFA